MWTLLAAYRPYVAMRRLIAAILVGTFSGSVEALALVSLLPLLQSGSGASPSGGYLAVFALLLLSAIGARVGGDLMLISLTQETDRKLRVDLLNRIATADWRYISAANHGDYASAFVSEATQIANGVSALAQGVIGVAVAAVLAASALVIEPVLTAMALSCGLVGYLAARSLNARSLRLQPEIAELCAVLNDEASGMLRNLRFMRASGAFREWGARLLEHVSVLRRLRTHELGLPVVARGLVELAGAGLIIGILAWTSARGEILRGLVFLAIFYRLNPRIQVGQQQFSLAKNHAVWLRRWDSRMHRMPPRQRGNSVLDRPVDHICVDAATVRYPGQARPALSRVSFTLRAGDSVAIVGETGAGKSTLLDLLTGVLDPDTGEVRVGGVRLDRLNDTSWGEQLSVVSQDPPVFTGSLLSNIAWLAGEPDIDRARRSVEQAQLSELVASLPDGIHTPLNAGGMVLSGGQRQRIALARAFYRRAPTLVLDEATSALDPTTEGRIIDEITTNTWWNFLIVVTHRMDLAMRMGKVLLLNNGELVEYGEPPSLLRQPRGLFRQLALAGRRSSSGATP